MFAVVRIRLLKTLVSATSRSAGERERTRANAEPCHSCHGYEADGGHRFYGFEKYGDERKLQGAADLERQLVGVRVDRFHPESEPSDSHAVLVSSGVRTGRMNRSTASSLMRSEPCAPSRRALSSPRLIAR